MYRATDIPKVTVGQSKAFRKEYIRRFNDCWQTLHERGYKGSDLETRARQCAWSRMKRGGWTKTDRVWKQNPERTQKLYGLDLELLLWKEEMTEDFFAILHKHQLMDPLGQVSYATKRGVMVKTRRWLTMGEMEEVLEALVSAGFANWVEYTYFPKSDPEKRVIEILL